MSTHRAELEKLQAKLRKGGEVCNFYVGPEGIESVFFRNRWRDPLSFAEMARPIVPGGRP
jgi:hypothetical protein